MNSIEDIKVGDCVRVGSITIDGKNKFAVTKVTATTFTIENGDRFMKKTGKKIIPTPDRPRSSFYRGITGIYASIWTDEDDKTLLSLCEDAEAEKIALVSQINAIDWMGLSNKKLGHVIKSLKNLGVIDEK